MYHGQDRSEDHDLDLIGHIPANARRVLALGPAAARLAAPFRLRQPRARWWAGWTQAKPDAAGPDRLIEVKPWDLATHAAGQEILGEGGVDVLVLDDVVQHLPDPRVQLRELAALLAPGGTMVVRLTNAAHWTAIRQLLQGESPFDPPSLSFLGGRVLTAEGLLALLQAAGLDGTKLSARRDKELSARQAEIRTAFAASAPVLGTSVDVLQRRLSEVMYVVTAQRAPLREMLRVHHVAFDGFCLPPRIDLPCTIMNSLPGIHATRSVGPQHRLPTVRDHEAKILVMQRQKVVDRAAFFATFGAQLRKGWLIVAEWDDDPDLLPEPVRQEWLQNPWLSISGAHACQVSTPRLRDLFGQHNPETVVFENGLAEIPALPAKSGARVRIVFGALNRGGVAQLIQPAIDRVAALDPRVEVVIIHDRAVFDAIETPRKRFVSRLGYPDYLAMLASADIALLPLAGREPELGKSDLKFVESASRGAAVIASPAIYEASIRDGETGFLARSPAEWTARLEELVRDDALRGRLARAAWDHVARHRLIGDQVARREAWYRSLWSRRDELTRQLFARHPEMAG